MTIKTLVVTGLLLALSALVVAQERGKIYLDPDDSFSSYLSAALQKKNVPVTITVDPTEADYTAQLQAKGSDGSILKSVLSRIGAGNYNNGSFNEVVMTIVDAKSKTVVFSYTRRKQSQNMDASSSLVTSVAECLAKNLHQSSHRGIPVSCDLFGTETC
jgi:hypothetical protein